MPAGSSTNRSPPTTPRGISRRSSPPRSRACRTARLARDLTAVAWRLERNVAWHDGKPFTPDDVLLFDYKYLSDPGHPPRSAAAPTATLPRVHEELDRRATSRWSSRSPGPSGPTPSAATGAPSFPSTSSSPSRARSPARRPPTSNPWGTGPYRFVDFKPGDTVRGELHPGYHVANRPFFDTIEMKGGGDAVSAARAVSRPANSTTPGTCRWRTRFCSGLEQSGKGRVNIWTTGGIEHMQCNFSDPWTEVDGERSSVKTVHPFLSDPAVRQALQPPRGPGRRAGADLWPPGPDHGQLAERAHAFPLPRTPSGHSTSTGPIRSSTLPDGSGDPTASGPRTARS